MQSNPFDDYPDLQTKYETARNKIAEEIEVEYKEKNTEKKLERLKGIEQDQEHRNLLNACIFPFSENGLISKLKYTFLRASPLYELKPKRRNFDFVIYNGEKNIAIFGEAKSSVGDETEVVRQTRERTTVIHENESYISTNYLYSSGSIFEFVLAVTWTDKDRIQKAILRTGGMIVTWQTGTDFHDEKLKLMLSLPSKEDGSSGETMRHSDGQLNKILSTPIPTGITGRTFFVESHPIAKMNMLIVLTSGNPDMVFGFEELLEFVKKEIGYLGDEITKEETKNILGLGVDIGLIKKEGSRYKFAIPQKKGINRYNEMKERWIDYSLRKEKESEITKKLEPTRHELEEEMSKRTKMDAFFPKGDSTGPNDS